MTIEKKRIKILFVAMAHSVHAAHWLNLVAQSDEFEVLLYSSVYVPPHQSLSPKVKVFYPALRGSEFYSSGKFYLVRRIIDIIRCKLAGVPSGSEYQPADPLTHLIKEQQPDIIHGLEFQHSCYLALEALKPIVKNERPIFGITNWGSDVYHFQKFPEHLAIIKELLLNADFYSCECARDIEIVKSLGYAGKLLPIIPGCGGLDTQQIKQIISLAEKPSKRKTIMIKGYQHFAGRSLTTLAALKECVNQLPAYEIYVFSASRKVKRAYREFANHYNLKIEFIKGITQRQMLTVYSKSRIFIATGVSDGISTSVLEAMAVGCFPIQSKSACCEEWFEHGKTGFATDAQDVSTIVSAINNALNDDNMVDNAGTINVATIEQRCDDREIQKTLLAEYVGLCTENQK